MNDRARIVQLQLDRAGFEALFLGEMLGEFRGGFAIDEEFEVVAPGNHMDAVPTFLANVGGGNRTFDRGHRRAVIFIDHQSLAAEKAVLLTSGCLEIPGAQDMFPDADVAQIGVVALKLALARIVFAGANADPAVALSGKAVAEFNLKVRELFIFENKVASFLAVGTDDHAVTDLPCL